MPSFVFSTWNTLEFSMARYLAMFALVQLVYAMSDLKAFDFVIVGGGTAGLLIANRLSANPNITVAVIEAGGSVYNNPNVTLVPRSIADFSPGLGTSIDWSYTSTPQKYSSNRTLPYSAGKALGGTTTINGMTYVRAEKAQIDAWEELGNDGWNWDAMWSYYLAQESFQLPSEEQLQNGASYDRGVHGRKGEVAVGFTPYLMGQGLFETVNTTSQALGHPFNQDSNSGHVRGTTTWPMMLNVTTKIRADAARAFYWSIASERPNLHIFLDTTATRILWDERHASKSTAVASGVELKNEAGSIQSIMATKEVIVAAGSIKSPAFLEHSGIGNDAFLRPLGIKTIVHRPTVGSNLQDQPANQIIYSSSSSKYWTGYATVATFLTAHDLFGSDLASLTDELQVNISDYAATIVSDYGSTAARPAATEQRLLAQQIDLIFSPNSTVPLAEILWFPVEMGIVVQFWNLLPLSRGSIHITSSNATAPPAINPNFFQLPIDMYVQAAIAIRIREFFATPPLSQLVTSEVSPTFELVPRNTTWRDPVWQTWIKKTSSSNSHPLSTCAMMSEELGGVVDTEGKVYGTKNVRVVDASVFPTQISGHLTASVYAIAGKISDAILSKL
jgi:choline dehydrogenase-like flavoprotein